MAPNRYSVKYTRNKDTGIPVWDHCHGSRWYPDPQKDVTAGEVGIKGEPGIPNRPQDHRTGLSTLVTPLRAPHVYYLKDDPTISADDAESLWESLRAPQAVITGDTLSVLTKALPLIGTRNLVYLYMYLVHTGTTLETAAACGHPEMSQGLISHGVASAIACLRRVIALQMVKGLTQENEVLLGAWLAKGTCTAAAKSLGQDQKWSSRVYKQLASVLPVMYPEIPGITEACNFGQPLYNYAVLPPGYREYGADDILGLFTR